MGFTWVPGRPADDAEYICPRCLRDQCERCTDRDCRCCGSFSRD